MFSKIKFLNMFLRKLKIFRNPKNGPPEILGDLRNSGFFNVF